MKLIFVAANEPMNFIKSIAQGHAASRNIITGQTFCFDHFTVENQIDARIKSTAIRRQTICSESLIRNVRYWKRGMMYISKCF